MKIRSATEAVLLLVSILFTPLSAVALEDTDRIYPGVFCQLRGDALRGEGEFVKTYKTARDRTVTDPLPMWHYLGISEFGSISNKSTHKGMPVVCPIESNLLSNSNGISVRVKFSTFVQANRGGEFANEFHCELTSVNDQGTGASRSVQSTPLDLKGVDADEVSTLTLSLPGPAEGESHAAGPDAGGYILACWLPGIREDAQSGKKIESKLIQYAVHAVDRGASYALKDSSFAEFRRNP